MSPSSVDRPVTWRAAGLQPATPRNCSWPASAARSISCQTRPSASRQRAPAKAGRRPRRPRRRLGTAAGRRCAGRPGGPPAGRSSRPARVAAPAVGAVVARSRRRHRRAQAEERGQVHHAVQAAAQVGHARRTRAACAAPAARCRRRRSRPPGAAETAGPAPAHSTASQDCTRASVRACLQRARPAGPAVRAVLRVVGHPCGRRALSRRP